MSQVPVLIRLEPGQKRALDEVRRRSGAPVSHHVRAAVRDYLLAHFPDVYREPGKAGVGITEDHQ